MFDPTETPFDLVEILYSESFNDQMGTIPTEDVELDGFSAQWAEFAF